MGNLRLLDYKVIDSKTIKLTFTEPLDTTISTTNIIITALSVGVPDLLIEKISIKSNILYVKTAPMTPQAVYKMVLSSTEQNSFKSISGSVLYEDGTTNAPLIQGPHNPENFFFNRMTDYLKDTPYDVDNPGLIRSYLETVSNQFYKAYNDIRQAKSDNYLSIFVEDEIHKRGKGPYDRLLNEGVYEITRVGLTRTGSTDSDSISFTSFPSEPISLQQEEVTGEVLFFGAKGAPETFNETECTLKYSNVIKINRIFIQYKDGSSLLYDIDAFGYQLQSSRYDDRSSTYVTLETNQFKLSEKAVLQGIKVPAPGDNITVNYVYKKLGREIDSESIEVYTVKKAVREVCPPLMPSFSLVGSHICDSLGNDLTNGGIVFLDPLAIPPFSRTHAAFTKEISYDGNRFPTNPGEYSIDYENGKVYVYGTDSSENPGTGLFPPAATYFYKQKYSKNIDYTFDPSTSDLAANPKRDLISKAATIIYDFEEALVPDIDFKEQIHKEELAERAENRVVGNGAVQVLYPPITSAFRVYNETSGEVYGINRFNDNTIFFSYKNPPLLISLINERVRFEQISGFTLVKTDEFENINSLRIFKFILGTTIISSTEDCIGSIINTSLLFTNTDTFIKEIYYSEEEDNDNVDKLSNVGEYVVNYNTGIIWVAVSGGQTDDVGAVSYKTKNIVTNFPHITAVNQVYSIINDESGKTKYTVNSFTDTTVDLLNYPISDNTSTVIGGDSIELVEEASSIRHIFDKNAILSEISSPIDFASLATVLYSNITILPIEKTWELSVEPDGTTIIVSDIIYTDSQVVLNEIISVKSATGIELYNTTLSDGSFSTNTITLPSDTTAVAGNTVFVRVKVFLNNNADVLVDYNRGEMYIDYIYCNDEIILSYEHGDNCIDFRETSALVPENTIYYVSYKYGALRDALFANFGSLIDIDILKNFNVDLDRERYRDALMACLQTFPKGPQIQAISNIAKIISHVEPEIWESFNDEWIVGQGHLYNNEAISNGPLDIIPGKFNYAVNISDPEDSIIIPFSSHIKLEQGTIEMFVIPNWDGIDNDATITFEIKRDGYYLSAENIWIGASGYHPELNYLYKFSLEKEEDNYGLPADIASGDPLKYGAFIYYDIDDTKWKVLFKDDNPHFYQATITTNGEFYNVKPALGSINIGDKITTTSKQVDVYMMIDAIEYDGYSLDGYAPAPFSFDGLMFMSDKEHYFFDYMADTSKPNENRISILKDGRGYLTFKVYAKRDVNNNAHLYQVSKDISDWKNGDSHFIATSWRIASKDKRDEIHLFVDGEETPNILRYGGRPVASITDRFRTVVPEIISDPVPKNTLTNIDMVITSGSDILYSNSSDFGIAGISIGDELYIYNPVIDGPDGYFTILEIVTGNSVRVNYTFTYNMTDVGFTVNPWTVPVSTNIMYESNIAVSIVEPGGNEIELPGLRATNPSYAIDVDTNGQPYLILRGNASAGDVIAIRTLGLNHRRVRERIYNWGTVANKINTFLPPPINLDHVKILPIILPKTSIDVSSPSYSPQMQPSSNEGRTLELIIGNTSNCNFTASPIEITITGTTYSGAVSELISATQAGYYNTTEQFVSISDISCAATVYNPLITSFSLEVREAYSITMQENDGYFAILRYSYKESTLNNLDGYSSTSTITSPVAAFDGSQVGFAISIISPPSAVATYYIDEVIDNKTITVTTSIPADFTGAIGELYNISIARSGYTNGLFTLELAGSAGIPYYLLEGYYDLDYSTYLDVPFEIKETNFALGSNVFESNQANSIIEELRSLDVLSTDTRVGEVLDTDERSITSDYNTVKAFSPDERTILLMHFDEKPFVDSSIPYQIYNSEYVQADQGVNPNFEDSLFINKSPLIIDNTNILFNNEGTIEFWVSPKFDTANDPNYRRYFDATASFIETITSLTRRDLVLQRAAKYIISITIPGYENNYAEGCSIANDGKTIRLGKELPNNNMELSVVYIPFRGNGDRISIYKSPANAINFDIVASGKLFSLSTPVFWSRDTWHRVTATWKCNSKTKQDEMHLFVDGVEKNKIVFGLGLNFGTVYTFNQLMNSSSPIIKTTINLRETFNKLFVGGNSFGGELACARFDNLKISKKMKNMITIGTQKLDNDYNSDLSLALPVIEDNYTTYLMNFDKEENKVEDFAILKNTVTGIFDFDLDVIDSFDIIRDNSRTEEILEELIKKLKPAVSRAFIKYIR